MQAFPGSLAEHTKPQARPQPRNGHKTHCRSQFLFSLFGKMFPLLLSENLLNIHAFSNVLYKPANEKLYGGKIIVEVA